MKEWRCSGNVCVSVSGRRVIAYVEKDNGNTPITGVRLVLSVEEVLELVNALLLGLRDDIESHKRVTCEEKARAADVLIDRINKAIGDVLAAKEDVRVWRSVICRIPGT